MVSNLRVENLALKSDLRSSEENKPKIGFSNKKTLIQTKIDEFGRVHFGKNITTGARPAKRSLGIGEELKESSDEDNSKF